MQPLEPEIDAIAAANDFSGVVRIDRDGEVELAKAYGLAHRGHEIANTVDTQFAVASGVKGLTAVAVVSLIEDGSLKLSTTARSVLGRIFRSSATTSPVEHLLSHRSGIGDYLDEDADHEITDYLMPVPVHELATTEQYLGSAGRPRAQVLARRAVLVLQRRLCRARADRRADERCSISRARPPAGMRTGGNGRLRVPALRRAAGAGGARVSHERRCVEDERAPPAGARQPATAGSTPPRPTSARSGPVSSRAGSCPRIWVAELVRPRSDVPRMSSRYGLGFWLHETSDAAMLEGYDAGVSFRSVHDPSRGITRTVISNTSEGAWPIARFFAELQT
mgnify:CR=1 FL=1